MLAFAERGRKVHLGIDAETLEIRAIEITGAGVGDAPMLPGLLDQIPADQPIAKVSADGAYDTRACHAAIAGRGAIAVIPTRRNGRPWNEDTPGADARNDILRSTARLGRKIWRPLSAASFGCTCRAMEGAVITDEAWSRYETGQKTIRGIVFPAIECTASSCSANGSAHATSTARSPSFQSEPRSSTASRPSEPQSRSAWHESVRGKGKLDIKTICAPCVTALAQEVFSELILARHRVLTCVRPHDAAFHMPRARMVFEGRVQIKAACSKALCCTLVLRGPVSRRLRQTAPCPLPLRRPRDRRSAYAAAAGVW